MKDSKWTRRKGVSYHVGPEEDGLAEDDDGSGLVERARDGGPRVRPGCVAAEAQVLGVGHGASARGTQPRPGRLHLRGAQHLPRLLHRQARRRRRRLPRGLRRRRGQHEAVEVDTREPEAEVPDPVGQGNEAVGRYRGTERRLVLHEAPEPVRRRRASLRHGSPQRGRHGRVSLSLYRSTGEDKRALIDRGRVGGFAFWEEAAEAIYTAAPLRPRDGD
jgi:hypothetical protein